MSAPSARFSNYGCTPNQLHKENNFQEPENWNEEKEDGLENPVLEKVAFAISSFLSDAKV